MLGAKYETELQRLLATCGGDWETLARCLFRSHQGTQLEINKDRKRLMRSFIAPKSLLIRGKTLDDIWAMQDKIDNYKKPRDTTKQSLRRLIKTLPTQNLRDEWEKILSGHNGKVRKSKTFR